MAVAVERIPQLILDADYRIVEIGPAAEGGLGYLEGRSLWEVEPDARPLFGPYYEKAWQSGQPVEFVQFYDGKLTRVEAAVRGGRLEISWEVLHRLDILTLEGLWASLEEAIALIERHEGRIARDRARCRLHAVEGGRR